MEHSLRHPFRRFRMFESLDSGSHLPILRGAAFILVLGMVLRSRKLAPETAIATATKALNPYLVSLTAYVAEALGEPNGPTWAGAACVVPMLRRAYVSACVCAGACACGNCARVQVGAWSACGCLVHPARMRARVSTPFFFPRARNATLFRVVTACRARDWELTLHALRCGCQIYGRKAIMLGSNQDTALCRGFRFFFRCIHTGYEQ